MWKSWGELIKISDVAHFTYISNEHLVLLKIFMLLPYYVYFYSEFFINSFNRYYFIK